MKQLLGFIFKLLPEWCLWLSLFGRIFKCRQGLKTGVRTHKQKAPLSRWQSEENVSACSSHTVDIQTWTKASHGLNSADSKLTRMTTKENLRWQFKRSFLCYNVCCHSFFHNNHKTCYWEIEQWRNAYRRTDYGWLKNFTDWEDSKYFAPSVCAAGANAWCLLNVCTHWLAAVFRSLTALDVTQTLANEEWH